MNQQQYPDLSHLEGEYQNTPEKTGGGNQINVPDGEYQVVVEFYDLKNLKTNEGLKTVMEWHMRVTGPQGPHVGEKIRKDSFMMPKNLGYIKADFHRIGYHGRLNDFMKSAGNFANIYLNVRVVTKGDYRNVYVNDRLEGPQQQPQPQQQPPPQTYTGPPPAEDPIPF